MGNIKGQANELTPLNPETNYEKSKAEAEKMVLGFKERIPVTVLRSALVLGPNEYWKKIVKLVGKGFPVIGSGENLFQVIYFKDLVSAIVFVLEKIPARGEVFIVAEEKGKTLKQLYELIQKELGIEKEIKTVPVWVGRLLGFFYSLLESNSIVSNAHISRLIRERNYSIKKIKAMGWKPKYSTEQAVKETVKALK
jgi:UDP-glucose 4-epimerase